MHADPQLLRIGTDEVLEALSRLEDLERVTESSAG
jgi:hypothetical protein